MRLILLFLLVVLPGLVCAETRVALVIGAERYETLRPLANPLNDARAVEQKLLALGFDVTLETNRDLRRMRRALEDFVYDYEGADVALVYFAGHGMEVAGQNLLLPVDAGKEDAETLVDDGLPLEEVAATLQHVAPVGLLIIDACRSDPFGAKNGGRGALSLAKTAQIKPGLARIGRSDNLLYAFSAAPGQAALDGQGDNSPFTEALTRHLATPGLEIRQVLTLVQQDVYDRTRGAQLPYVESGLPELVFAGGTSALPEREVLLLSMAGMTDAHRGLIERVATEHDMPLAPLFGAFLSADLAGQPRDQQQAELKSAARAFVALRQDMVRLGSDDPRVSALRSDARAQLELGAFDLARAKLTEAAEIDRSSRDRLRDNYIARTVSEAETFFLTARAAEADLRRDLAVEDYGQAVALFEEARKTDADNTVSFRHIVVTERIAELHLLAGRIGEAAAQTEQFIALSREFVAQNPGSVDGRKALAAAHIERAGIARTQGRKTDEAQQIKQAIATLQAGYHLLDGADILLSDLVSAMNDLASLQLEQGDRTAAILTLAKATPLGLVLLNTEKNTGPVMPYWRTKEILARISSDRGDYARANELLADLVTYFRWEIETWPEDDAEPRAALSSTLHTMSENMRFAGDLLQALQFLKEAQQTLAPVVEADPENVNHQINMAEMHSSRALLETSRERTSSAMESSKAALAIYDRILEIDGSHARARLARAFVYLDLADQNETLGQGKDALTYLIAAEDGVRGLMEDRPEDANLGLELVIILQSQADFVLSFGRTDLAKRALDEAVTLVETYRKQNLTDLSVHSTLGALNLDLAEVALKETDFKLAETHLQAALKRLKHYLGNSSESIYWMHEHALTHFRLAEVDARQDNATAAIAHYEDAAEVLADIGRMSPDNPKYVWDQFAVNIRLSQLAENKIPYLETALAVASAAAARGVVSTRVEDALPGIKQKLSVLRKEADAATAQE